MDPGIPSGIAGVSHVTGTDTLEEKLGMVATYYGPNTITPQGEVRRTSDGSLLTTTQTRYSGKGRLESVTSPGPPYKKQNNFLSCETDGKPPVFNGTGRFGITNISLSNYCTDNSGPASWLGNTVAVCPFAPSYEQWMLNSALAGVNPSKPAVNIANFLWELREFPSMLRDLGRYLGERRRGTLLEDAPGAHLAWQFGWAPLYRDLMTLLHLGEEIAASQARFKEGLGRKKMGGRLRKYTTHEKDAHALGYNLGTVTREWECNIEIWYTAHYASSVETPDFLFDSSRFSTALGSRQPLSAIWASLPWSWLIDYFTGVGTYLEATEGMAEFSPATICIMIQTDVKTTEIGFIPGSGFRTGDLVPGSFKGKQKQRVVVKDPAARPYWEPLGFTKNLPILGSLVTARALRSM